jgi:hypothetical protein
MTDLGASLFLEDIFFWDNYCKEHSFGVGHYFRLKRVKKMKSKHRSLILIWFEFVSKTRHTQE